MWGDSSPQWSPGRGQESSSNASCQHKGPPMKLASPSVGAHMPFAWANSEGFSEGAELGYEVALLEWKVDTAAQGIELMCGDLG